MISGIGIQYKTASERNLSDLNEGHGGFRVLKKLLAKIDGEAGAIV